jgi:class 3 adenylate cyclase
MPKQGFISLRMTMAVAFALTVIATSALIGAVGFFAARAFINEGIRLRLQDITTLAASGVDPETTAKLRKREDEDIPEYAKVKGYLQKVKQTDPDIQFVYLYRIEPSGKVYFVADNEPEDSKNISHLGDEYDEMPELGRAQYRPGVGAETEKDFTKDQWGAYLSSYIPIVNASGQIECALGIDMSARAVQNYEVRFLKALLSFTLLTTAFVLIASVWCSRRISRPLLKIADDLGRVQRLELDGETNIHSIVREVIIMRDAVTKLKSSLRSFRKYVPADLVADLMALGQEARLSAEKHEVTIFFSDIVNFTTISERIPPEQLVDDLAIYFDGMTRAIVDHKGTVDKYIGDAIMAFWGAPRPLSDHAVQACLAAIKCRDHARAAAEQQRQKGQLPMLTRIGLNSGAAIIGNIGYDERLNYTAVGDMVNLGSRLEGLNKIYGTEILISEATWLLAQDAIEARFVDVVAVKGKSVPVRIYELICARGDLTPEQATLAREYQRGMDHYLNRQFGAGIEVFEKLLASFPDELASSVMLERSRALLSAPPPPEWQGEFFMNSK